MDSCYSLSFLISIVHGLGVYEVGLAIACFNLTSNEKVSIFFLTNLLCRCEVVGGGCMR